MRRRPETPEGEQAPPVKLQKAWAGVAGSQLVQLSPSKMQALTRKSVGSFCRVQWNRERRGKNKKKRKRESEHCLANQSEDRLSLRAALVRARDKTPGLREHK